MTPGELDQRPDERGHRRLVVVPPVPALLASNAGLEDPVPELRAACRRAVSWLVADAPTTVAVLGDEADRARGVADELLASAGFAGRVATSSDGDALLVLANGSARRSEKAPGYLDERSHAFDDAIGAALRGGDAAALGRLDPGLGVELLASGTAALRALGGRTVVGTPTVDYADDPFGVQYWVVRWELDR